MLRQREWFRPDKNSDITCGHISPPKRYCEYRYNFHFVSYFLLLLNPANTKYPITTATISTIVRVLSLKLPSISPIYNASVKRRGGCRCISTPDTLPCFPTFGVQGYLLPPIPLTTPIRIAAATSTRNRFWIKTEPVSVPVMMEVMPRISWFPTRVDYLFTHLGWLVYSLYAFRRHCCLHLVRD